ncbi:hypothetical protein NDU88_006786 [Pleurodeles waltl]|uniref:Retrotransposon gag domain-containing protein n=1 Tax=Pleurodeles waltl TaxID=8319 RepID=A0AAV7UMM0_PLEWA|nr:hypothetical protein NDU88_006786 [Pleurodeles waltl]
MLDLNKYFAPKVCVGIVRYKFFQRKQEKCELVNDYIADLKKLALDCKFGAIHDELIRDQVVMHCNNQSIQERLWINGDSPLDEILALIRKAEISERCFSELKSTEKNEDSIFKVTNRKSGKGFQSGENERRCYRLAQYIGSSLFVFARGAAITEELQEAIMDQREAFGVYCTAPSEEPL